MDAVLGDIQIADVAADETPKKKSKDKKEKKEKKDKEGKEHKKDKKRKHSDVNGGVEVGEKKKKKSKAT
jgi:nucleolar protein 56